MSSLGATHEFQADLAVPRRARTDDPDRAVEHVPRSPFASELGAVLERRASAASPGILRRACACGGTPGPDGECAACKTRRLELQRRAETAAAPGQAPPVVHRTLRSPGRPLDAPTRAFFEPRLGRDLGGVRLHTDPLAAASARAVGAAAYTVGSHVVFGTGRYRPATDEGRRLVAHELAHVVQQDVASALRPQLEIGPAHDPAEVEADRLAEAVLAGAPPRAPPTPGRVLLRRTPDGPPDAPASQGPQRVGEERMGPPQTFERSDGTKVFRRMFRTLVHCPCRKIPEVREGVFANPNLNTLAIAWRRCRGGVTTTAYADLQSNAANALGGAAPFSGTGHAGVDVNVYGGQGGPSGRVQVEGVGTNVGGTGVGAHAQGVYQTAAGDVIYLDLEYLRRLGTTTGRDPNEVTGRLGGLPRSSSVGAEIDVGTPPGGVGGVQVTGQIVFRPGAQPPAPIECWTCFCPPAARVYRCVDYVLPPDRPGTRDVDVDVDDDLRYYFALDRSDRTSEDPGLAARSAVNLDTVVDRLRGGGDVTLVMAYASPEANELRHNQELSQRRAQALVDLVRARVPNARISGPPVGAGELLGRRPAAAASSRLGDVITAHGFRSAADLTILLSGPEIERPDLAEQFRSLFRALPEDRDRLAVFDVPENDPLARDLLAAIDQFTHSRGGGGRPWEAIFRRLRYGFVRVHRVVRQQVPTVERGTLSEVHVERGACDMLAAVVERNGGFGPVDPSALRPDASEPQAASECDERPTAADRELGCSYRSEQRSTAPPPAPPNAPVQLHMRGGH